MRESEGMFENTEQEPKLKTNIDIDDLRAGHWPGTKTPPLLLNEMWEIKNPHWRESVEKIVWQDGYELLVGSGVIDMQDQKHEVDIYARRDPRRGEKYFGFAAYPKGKKFDDFWNEDGTEKETEGD